ncbi:MAG: hypothetical protein AB8F94_13105 [Saprospiraceae bacterium]
MKKVIYLSLSFLLFFSCNRPLKLLEKGKDEKALKSSMQRLKRGKVKPDLVYVFEQSFHNVTDKDAQIILEMRNAGQPKLWLEIREKAIDLDNRQIRVEKIARRIATKGYFPELDFYPAKKLIEEATDNVALYFYAQALEYIPSARNGEKRAARKAYAQILNCMKYRPNFKDAPELEKEMLELGTTRILIQPVATNLSDGLENQLFDGFFYKNKFPKTYNWKIVYLEKPTDSNIDFYAEFYFDQLRESGCYTSESCCSNTETIQTGCEIQKVWNEKDSAYVEITVPVYEDVSVSVRTFQQNLDTSLELFCDLINAKTNQKAKSFSVYERSCWGNEYSTVSGDHRALSLLCSDEGGSWRSPPDPVDLWFTAASNARYGFIKKLKKSVY